MPSSSNRVTRLAIAAYGKGDFAVPGNVMV